MKKYLVDNKAVNAEDTKVTFGAISSTTPSWAKWVFRIVFLFTTVFTAWLASTGLIPATTKLEITYGLTALNATAFGFSKMFGITLDK